MLKKLITECVFAKRQYSTKKIGILGVPFGKGQPKKGVTNGPDAIRNGGLVEQLSEFYHKPLIKDYGNLDYRLLKEIGTVPNMNSYDEVMSCNKELSKKVEEILAEDRLCLNLGGDHAIAIGSIDGHLKAKKDICVIYIDAHCDINTNKTSGSGNIHGMPVSIVTREMCDYWPFLPGMEWQEPTLSVRNIAYIGLRSVDPYERVFVDKFGIAAFSMAEIEECGIHTVINMALKAIDPEQNRSIHVSFDIDALDPLDAPCTSITIPGGLTVREGIHILERVHDTGRLNVMDIVELNTDVGTEQDAKKTVGVAIQLLAAACGFKRGGIRPKDATLPLQNTQNKNTNSYIFFFYFMRIANLPFFTRNIRKWK
ncbi:arginase, hepatic [Diabrotica undecimpunctata]|uniref:arginase, hepatic n=1 Tax=Diabrotica undecimpunctata TaxID=50387 RepID=UPI003B6356E4